MQYPIDTLASGINCEESFVSLLNTKRISLPRNEIRSVASHASIDAIYVRILVKIVGVHQSTLTDTTRGYPMIVRMLPRSLMNNEPCG